MRESFAHQDELPRPFVVREALDFAISSNPRRVNSEQHRFALSPFTALVQAAGTGDQIDLAASHGNAFEVIRHRVTHIRQLEFLHDRPLPIVDLEDDAGFVVVRQKPLVAGHRQTRDFPEPARKLPVRRASGLKLEILKGGRLPVSR